MIRLMTVIFYLIVLLFPRFCHAEAVEEYEEADKILVAAGGSVAAYSDRIGELATSFLEERGWKLNRYTQMQGRAGARFLLAKKEFTPGKLTYILAYVGTENSKDVDFDLKVDKVYFAGSSLAEFSANAAKKDVPNTEPKIHRGFFEFVQSGLQAKTSEDDVNSLALTDELLAHPDYKIYLVGHSLGGAAATLAGAALISMGVQPEQIEVITFGAPAVGNSAFVAKFNPTLKLTRIVISGDPVTGVLQGLVGGYKQFGKEIRWELPDIADQPHRVTEYVDFAFKNYYDKRRQVREAGIALPEPVAAAYESSQRVYIASLKNSLPYSLSRDFWYMREALGDECRQRLPGCIVADEGDVNWREKAVSLGSRWVVVPELSVTQLKNERNTYYITLNETVYEETTGSIVETASFSTGTYNLTPLEAFIHDLKGISHNKNAVLR